MSKTESNYMTIKPSEKETLMDVGPCGLKFLSVPKGFTSFKLFAIPWTHCYLFLHRSLTPTIERLERKKKGNQKWLKPFLKFTSCLEFENGCCMSQMSQWVMSHESWVNESMSQIWKNKSFGRNNKIKHYFYLICPLASLLPVHARPTSDMKSQPGLFVSSIPGPAATVTCMPQKIAFPDTLPEPFKPSDNPYY